MRAAAGPVVFIARAPRAANAFATPYAPICVNNAPAPSQATDAQAVPMPHGDAPDSSSGVGGVDYEQVSNFAHRSAVFPQSVPEIPARVSVSAALNRSASIAGVPIVRHLRGGSYASFPRGTGRVAHLPAGFGGMEQSVGIGVGRSFRRATAHCWNASLFACCRLLPLAAACCSCSRGMADAGVPTTCALPAPLTPSALTPAAPPCLRSALSWAHSGIAQ